MLAAAAGLLALASALPAAAAPVHYELAVRLDPAARTLSGRAIVTLPDESRAGLELAPSFTVDLREEERRHGRRRIELSWKGSVPQADARGTFLPAAAAWYPRVAGQLASHTVTLELPPGQVGVVPGTLVEEHDGPQGYRARFEFPHPGEGIDLMAGPYRVEERMHAGAGGRPIRLRAYFHPELSALAPGYLDAAGGYLELYERRIAPYPFAGFGIVSSPTPTGLGLPGLTYLGIEVLKLPFIRATSLGHEVLHNWWGNGVYADYARGNWAEGLTTFMADYAYREREGAEAARAMRLGWLRDVTALRTDAPLAEFTSRTHGTSQVVGYAKSAMVFFMLRDTLGSERFDQALRAFWAEHRFRTAAWSDLQRALEAQAGQSLSTFFEQWLARRGAPAVRITAAGSRRVQDGWEVTFSLAQDAPPYALRIPVLLRTADREEARTVELNHQTGNYRISTAGEPRELLLDPELRVLRKLAPDEAPPILRELILDPAPSLLILSEVLRAPGEGLARRLLDNPFAMSPPEQDRHPGGLLVIGLHGEVDRWLAQRGLPPRPEAIAGKGSAQSWMVAAGARPVAVVSVEDGDALAALARPLPHYGAQSYLAFAGARALERGVWPSRPQRWRLTSE